MDASSLSAGDAEKGWNTLERWRNANANVVRLSALAILRHVSYYISLVGTTLSLETQFLTNEAQWRLHGWYYRKLTGCIQTFPLQ